MKKILLLMLLCTALVCTLITETKSQVTKRNWDRLTEAQILMQSDSLGKVMGLDKEESYNFAVCVTDKLKAQFPDIKKAPPKEVFEYTRKIGAECGMEYREKIIVKWTPNTIKILSNYIMEQKGLDFIKEEYRKAYIDCIINKLKIKFPSGISMLKVRTSDAVMESCLDQLTGPNE